MRDMKRNYILSAIVSAIPVAAGIVLYSRLPEQIVIHWDFNGDPNGWSSRLVGAIIFPGILLLLTLLMPKLMKVDPKYRNIPEKVKVLMQWIIPAVALVCSGVSLSDALGIRVDVPFCGTILVGLMFTVIGNYMPKLSQSYTVGIKLPWTLADEENWDKTHRIAGFLWTACGLLMIVYAFVPMRSPWVYGALLALAVLVPTVYSYLLYRAKHREA